jgi:hypothetical protein
LAFHLPTDQLQKYFFGYFLIVQKTLTSEESLFDRFLQKHLLLLCSVAEEEEEKAFKHSKVRGKKNQEKACTIDSVQLMRTFGYKIITQIANLVLQPHHKVSPLLFLLSTFFELSSTQRGNYKLKRRDR